MITKKKAKKDEQVIEQTIVIEPVQTFICNRNNGRIFPYSDVLERTLDNFYLCDINGNPL